MLARRRWWYDELEVDVAGLNGETETLLLGECKWTDEPVDHSVLSDLEALEPEVRWHGTDRTVQYALFSKSGFTPELHETATQREEVLLFTVEDVLDCL